jgi:hypothetical protein
MPLLHRLACPHSGSAETRLVKPPAALARLAAAVATAFLLADLVPLAWRCRECGEESLAVGDRACGGIAARGFPIGDTKERPKR